MTTVAWDGKTLACDRQAVANNTRRRVRKLFDCGEYHFAGCGNFDDVHIVAEWLTDGAKRSERPTFEDAFVHGLAVRKSDGAAFLVEGKRPVLCRLFEADACGSGREYALAAMAFGKTAAQAVTFAMRFDVGTGMGVDSVRVKKP